MSEKGMKADGLRYDLIPPEALAELAYVYTAGARKYADRNWELGYPTYKTLRALKSHLNHYEAGEDVDPETQALHLAQVMWHCAALITWAARKNPNAVDGRARDANAGYVTAVKNRPVPEVPKYVVHGPETVGQTRAEKLTSFGRAYGASEASINRVSSMTSGAQAQADGDDGISHCEFCREHEDLAKTFSGLVRTREDF